MDAILLEKETTLTEITLLPLSLPSPLPPTPTKSTDTETVTTKKTIIDDESPMQCPFCNLVFKRSNGWSRHMTVKHLDLYNSYDTSSKQTWNIYAQYMNGATKEEICTGAAKHRQWLNLNQALIRPTRETWRTRLTYLMEQHSKTKFQP
jgi:uncharacterized C2H2 Zn-finger protein